MSDAKTPSGGPTHYPEEYGRYGDLIHRVEGKQRTVVYDREKGTSWVQMDSEHAIDIGGMLDE